MHLQKATDGSLQSITFLRPSNFHAHLRQGDMMQAIAKHIMRHVFYLLVMPNTGPILTMADALRYHDELMAIAEREGFDKLRLIMTLYHTDQVTPAVIEEIAKSSIVRAVKHYPPVKGLTTNSGLGMPLEESDEMFYAMEDCGVPALFHCEAATPDPRDGEATAIREQMWKLRDKHPRLKICIEHASTAAAVEFVKADTSGNTVMTITPHHMNFAYPDLESHGPCFKCKPILNTPENQAAVSEFACSGDYRAIAGDDTAAHLSSKKFVAFEEAANGCFLSEHSAPLHAKAFIEAGAMDERFENFMSRNGPRWWGLPEPDQSDTITLVRSENDLPEPVPVPGENDVVIPFGWDSDPAKRIHIGWAVQD